MHNYNHDWERLAILFGSLFTVFLSAWSAVNSSPTPAFLWGFVCSSAIILALVGVKGPRHDD